MLKRALIEVRRRVGIQANPFPVHRPHANTSLSNPRIMEIILKRVIKTWKDAKGGWFQTEGTNLIVKRRTPKLRAEREDKTSKIVNSVIPKGRFS
ncbi:MAG: hypothetical protein V1915_01870 [Candidatus Bathyarchaeota archaeon]